MTEFSELRAELAQNHAENSRRLDSLQQSQRHVTDHLSELHQDVRQINGTLNGPDGVLVRLDRTTTKLETVEQNQSQCPARTKFLADATAPGVPAVTNAAAVLAHVDSIPPNRAKVVIERHKTLRQAMRTFGPLVLAVLAAIGGTIGVQQLLTPAQASHPAASSTSTH